MDAVPRFPLLGEPAEWDALTLRAATLYLEAEGEPVEGKVSIAWVMQARAETWHLTIHQVLLGPEGRAYGDGKAYEPFSCWNDDYTTKAKARLASAQGDALEQCWRAAAGAQWRLITNPVPRAIYYLNVELTKKIRKGTLPAWAADPRDASKLDQTKLVGVVGHHAFLSG